jgi:hypothetical protein
MGMPYGERTSSVNVGHRPGEKSSPDSGDLHGYADRVQPVPGRDGAMTDVSAAVGSGRAPSTARPGPIDRHNLAAALDHAAEKKVTVISAPAGSKKTSLLRVRAGHPGQDRRIAFMSVRPASMTRSCSGSPFSARSATPPAQTAVRSRRPRHPASTASPCGQGTDRNQRGR